MRILLAIIAKKPRAILLMLLISHISVMPIQAALPQGHSEANAIIQGSTKDKGSRTIQQKTIPSIREKEAMAFLLGWDAKTILLQTTAEDHKKILFSIQRYTQALNVTLPHDVSFYFIESDLSDGTRAQAFAEETFAELKMSDMNVANHFGAATNLLLMLAHQDLLMHKADTQELIDILDMPAHLKRIPDRDLLDWAAHIHDYFEESLK